LRHVRISGAGTITLEKLDQRELGLAISGSGDIQAQGTVERVSAEISGMGNVRLADLALKRLKTRISGSGRVEAGPTDEADIHLSGAGTVKLLTRPAALHTKVSGAGRIIQPSVESADKK
jgi:Putative auto-transporter adhesin, head GIN domain